MDAIRAIFFDIDGTLGGQGVDRLPDQTICALEKARARGVKLCVCTGRTADELSILSGFDFDAYGVMNGQYCYAGDAVLRLNPLPREDVETLVRLVETEDVACCFVELHQSYLSHMNAHALDMFETTKLPVPTIGEARMALENDIYQVNLFTTPEHEETVLARLPGCMARRWNARHADIIALSGGKRDGVEAMLAHFGIPPEQALSVGDGENDIDMFVATGHSAAMANASEKVRCSAEFVTGRCDEDGIAEALRHFGIID